MSRRRAVRAHLETLGEIRGIMGAMKNMALSEHRKVGRRLEAQGRVVRGIETAAADVLAYYPEALPEPPAEPGALTPVLVVIGSERGFCGDFNQALAQEAESRAAEHGAHVLGVGYKLALRLEGRPGVARVLDGAGVVEEVARALSAVVAALGELEAEHGPLNVVALHHDATREGLRTRTLLPPFRDLVPAPRSGYPPMLYLAPEVLVARLVDQHLLAALNEAFLGSLLAENEQRMRHLEGAVRRLEEHQEALTRKANALRQEEITEEIEMILLNVEAGASGPGTSGPPRGVAR